MKLLIVESPTKAGVIQQILGDDWIVKASFGHVRDMPLREMGMKPPQFVLDYEIGERAQRVVSQLRELARQAETVYLATDPDREGEAISWHLAEVLGLSRGGYRRVTWTAVNAESVHAGIRAARDIDYNLVHAQECRRALDRLIGYGVSPVLRDSIGDGASAGRVQSPAVRLVVDREIEREAFKPTQHFGAAVQFGEGKAAWTAEWDSDASLPEGTVYNLDRSLAERVATCRDFIVREAEAKRKRVAPPAPFNTLSMLSEASKRLGFDADKTSKLAQRLFEGPTGGDHGFISYHRTDGLNHDASTVAEIRTWAAATGLAIPDAPRKFKDKAGTQGGHEAIRPLDLSVEVAGATPDEQALYALIRERAIRSQLADGIDLVTTATLQAQSGGTAFDFKASGTVPDYAGWRAFGPTPADDGDEDAGDAAAAAARNPVPLLNVDAQLQAASGRMLSKVTKAPPRFTESSLLKRLESLGIGRPATYASIFKNILERGYVVMEKKQFAPTPIGRDLVKALRAGEFGFIEFNFTRDLEGELDLIAEGKRTYAEVVAGAWVAVADDVKRVKASGMLAAKHPCPKCRAPMRRCRGKNGVFWACSNPDREACGHLMDDKGGQPAERATHPCPDCNATMFRRKGENGFFWSCSAYSTTGCKCTLPDVKGKAGPRKAPATLSEHTCIAPGCGKPLIRRKGVSPAKGRGKTAKPARPYDFYGCSGYPACDKTYQTGSDGTPILVLQAQAG